MCKYKRLVVSPLAVRSMTWHRGCALLAEELRLRVRDCNSFAGGNAMPDRDGTGPTGKGPLTGKSLGSCILRIPDSQDEPIQGFAGESGRPVSFGGKPQTVKGALDMPRCDRTGPSEARPGTGRIKGFSMGFGNPGTLNRSQDFASPGRGGGGQGRRNRFFNTGLNGGQRSPGFGFGRGTGEFVGPGLALDLEPEPQLETLKVQAGYFEIVLEGIKRRIQKLESRTEGNQ